MNVCDNHIVKFIEYIIKVISIRLKLTNNGSITRYSFDRNTCVWYFWKIFDTMWFFSRFCDIIWNIFREIVNEIVENWWRRTAHVLDHFFFSHNQFRHGTWPLSFALKWGILIDIDNIVSIVNNNSLIKFYLKIDVCSLSAYIHRTSMNWCENRQKQNNHSSNNKINPIKSNCIVLGSELTMQILVQAYTIFL